jgi:hypothetical protein
VREKIPANHGKENEAYERGSTGNGSESFHESRNVPPLDHFFDQKRGDDGDAEAVQITFPPQAVRIEGKQGKDKPRKGKERGH